MSMPWSAPGCKAWDGVLCPCGCALCFAIRQLLPAWISTQAAYWPTDSSPTSSNSVIASGSCLATPAPLDYISTASSSAPAHVSSTGRDVSTSTCTSIPMDLMHVTVRGCHNVMESSPLGTGTLVPVSNSPDFRSDRAPVSAVSQGSDERLVCGAVEAPSVIRIPCPLCSPPSEVQSNGHQVYSSLFEVKPTSTAKCKIAQHLIEFHGIPLLVAAGSAPWLCIFLGCKCRKHIGGRCTEYPDDAHAAHVRDPWSHILKVHLGFRLMCKCGKEYSSSDALCNHVNKTRRLAAKKTRLQQHDHIKKPVSLKRSRNHLEADEALDAVNGDQQYSGTHHCSSCYRAFPSLAEYNIHPCHGFTGPASGASGY